MFRNDLRSDLQNSTTMDIPEGLFICLVFINKIPVLRKPTFTFQIKASCFPSSSSVYSHLFKHNISIQENEKYPRHVIKMTVISAT